MEEFNYEMFGGPLALFGIACGMLIMLLILLFRLAMWIRPKNKMWKQDSTAIGGKPVYSYKKSLYENLPIQVANNISQDPYDCEPPKTGGELTEEIPVTKNK